jgi:hypothetical protein
VLTSTAVPGYTAETVRRRIRSAVLPRLDGGNASGAPLEAVWELSLGIHLIAKRFRPDARLFARERSEAGADDFAFRAGETGAAPAGA